MPEAIDFPRYLAAKRSVDDRALNAEVWAAFAKTLSGIKQPRIIELGAGTGQMAERVRSAGLLRDASYTLLDADSDLLARAEEQLDDARVFAFKRANAVEWAEKQQGQWDVLIAHAFLDLIDLNSALPNLLGLLRPGGYFYFPINYDGDTSFQPQVNGELEQKILQLYHRSMDERMIDGQASGHSQTGRRLYEALPSAGGIILAAGDAGWDVQPVGGSYLEDEDYFLRSILLFFANELSGHPEIDSEAFENWLATRREQIEWARLSFSARNIDFFGRFQAVE